VKLKLRKPVLGALALSAVSAILLGGASIASAATPPFEPDTTNQYGQVLFYDASGNMVTSGSINSPISAYAVATTNDPNVGHFQKAALFGYLPVNGVAPGAWSGTQLSQSTTFPAADATAPTGHIAPTTPASIGGLSSDRPVVTEATTDKTLAQLQTQFPNTATDAYQGLYQLRVKVSGESQWWAADVKITGSTWALVYPSITSTTLAASPASPQSLATDGGTPATVTLTASLTASVPGSVQFFRNGSALGSPVAASGGTTNTATKTDVPAGPSAGGSPVTTNYTATFTPTDPSFISSSSSAVAYVVQNPAPAAATTTDLAVTQDGIAGDDVQLTSNVHNTPTPGTVPVGSVSWYDNGSATPLNTTPVAVNGSGVATFDIPAGLTVGAHSIVAKFTPTNAAQFIASQSSPAVFSLTAPLACTPGPKCDPQTFVVDVNAGTLTISTPYTGADAAHTFNLGAMALSSDGTKLHASAPFGSSTLPAAGATFAGVTITDTRAGNGPWTASVYGGDFLSGSDKINGQNLGFTGVQPLYIGGNALSASNPVVTNDVANSGPGTIFAAGASGTAGLKGSPSVQHQFATAAHGDGTVYVYGTMDLYAPTSTPAGHYTGVVTFTIA